MITGDTTLTIDLAKLGRNMDAVRRMAGDEVAIMAVIKANLVNTVKEGMFAFFNGTKTVENDYAAWLDTLEAQGLSTLIEIHQTAYDAQYK